MHHYKQVVCYPTQRKEIMKKIGNGKYKTSMGIVLNQRQRDSFLKRRKGQIDNAHGKLWALTYLLIGERIGITMTYCDGCLKYTAKAKRQRRYSSYFKKSINLDFCKRCARQLKPVVSYKLVHPTAIQKGEIMAKNMPWSVKCNSCGKRELSPIKPGNNYNCSTCSSQFDIYNRIYGNIGASVS